MDFTANLTPRSSRRPLGRAAKIRDEDGLWRYAVFKKTQLHGDEGVRRGLNQKVSGKVGAIHRRPQDFWFQILLRSLNFSSSRCGLYEYRRILLSSHSTIREVFEFLSLSRQIQRWIFNSSQPIRFTCQQVHLNMCHCLPGFLNAQVNRYVSRCYLIWKLLFTEVEGKPPWKLDLVFKKLRAGCIKRREVWWYTDENSEFFKGPRNFYLLETIRIDIEILYFLSSFQIISVLKR